DPARESQRERRGHRSRPSARRHRGDADRYGDRRARAARPDHRPRHHVHRREAWESRRSSRESESHEESWDVQCPQRVALFGIVARQYGHSFWVGSPGRGGAGDSSRLIWRISRKSTKATITKSRTLLKNTP